MDVITTTTTATTSCEWPPKMKSVEVVESQATTATINWSIFATNSATNPFAIELRYNPKGKIAGTWYRIGSHDPLVTLENLQESTEYNVQLFTSNQCAYSTPISTNFTTKRTDLDPRVLHLMSHEVILTMFIVMLWLLVVRHFYRTMNRVTYIAPKSGGYYYVPGLNPQGKTVAQDVTDAESGSYMDCLSLLERMHPKDDAMTGSQRSLSSICARNEARSRVKSMSHLGSVNRGLLESNAQQWRNSTTNLRQNPHTQRCALGGLGMSRSLCNISSTSDPLLKPSSQKNLFNGSHSFPVPRGEPMKQEQILEEPHGKLQETPDWEEEKDSLTPLPEPKGKPPTGNLRIIQQSDNRRISQVLLGKATTDIRRSSVMCKKVPGEVKKVKSIETIAEDGASSDLPIKQKLSHGSLELKRNLPMIVVRRATTIRRSRDDMDTALLDGRVIDETVTVDARPMIFPRNRKMSLPVQQQLLSENQIKAHDVRKKGAFVNGSPQHSQDSQHSVESYHTAHTYFEARDALSVL